MKEDDTVSDLQQLATCSQMDMPSYMYNQHKTWCSVEHAYFDTYTQYNYCL